MVPNDNEGCNTAQTVQANVVCHANNRKEESGTNKEGKTKREHIAELVMRSLTSEVPSRFELLYTVLQTVT